MFVVAVVVVGPGFDVAFEGNIAGDCCVVEAADVLGVPSWDL